MHSISSAVQVVPAEGSRLAQNLYSLYAMLFPPLLAATPLQSHCILLDLYTINYLPYVSLFTRATTVNTFHAEIEKDSSRRFGVIASSVQLAVLCYNIYMRTRAVPEDRLLIHDECTRLIYEIDKQKVKTQENPN